jgi:hypothetical protein
VLDSPRQRRRLRLPDGTFCAENPPFLTRLRRNATYSGRTKNTYEKSLKATWDGFRTTVFLPGQMDGSSL